MTPPRIAISIPQLIPDGTFDPGAFRRYLSRAEQLGFDGAWSTEQVIGTAPNLDPSAILAYAAACTERIRLGCAVFVSTVASPLHLAKAIAALDQLSRGRLEVGFGTGGRFRPFAAFGIDGDGFVSRFTEGVRYMQAAWTQERIDFDGRFWQAKGLAMEPKPYQKPHPPLWFGGGHPNSLRRAVRLADGYIGAGSTTTADFIDHGRILQEELDRVDRDPAGFRVAKRVYLAVEDDPAVARERLSVSLSELYGFFGMTGVERLGVSGRPAEVAAEIRSIVAAGAGMVLLNPLYNEAEQMERLAAEVVPQLT